MDKSSIDGEKKNDLPVAIDWLLPADDDDDDGKDDDDDDDPSIYQCSPLDVLVCSLDTIFLCPLINGESSEIICKLDVTLVSWYMYIYLYDRIPFRY